MCEVYEIGDDSIFAASLVQLLITLNKIEALRYNHISLHHHYYTHYKRGTAEREREGEYGRYQTPSTTSTPLYYRAQTN